MASDVYAFSLVSFALFSGQLPFQQQLENMARLTNRPRVFSLMVASLAHMKHTYISGAPICVRVCEI